MTEVQIDCSQLPPVQEICRDFAVLEDGALAHCLQEQEVEQHYASNVQKHQLVQKDIRIAKKLQDVEDQERKLCSSDLQKQIEESDSEFARAIQEEIQRKAQECQQREEKDKEIAKRLQELEKEEIQRQKWRLKNSDKTRDENAQLLCGVDSLNRQMEELDLQSQKQLQQDEELARRLQEEEATRTRAKRNRERNDDYRAAQVAQDEEIARYMQEQELKAQQRSHKIDLGLEDNSEGSSLSEQRQSRDKKNYERSDSGEAASPARGRTLEKTDLPVQGGSTERTKKQLPRNIAEDLDPTFKSKKTEPVADVFAVCSQAAAQSHTIPVDGLFDYMDDTMEPAFVSATKRHSEKLGRQKSRDKKEGCKQQ
uniref:Coiled-coil domain-containing protein n=1 Tax=Sphenodon punctatus TaxID=8508 RepID=A0A8D0H823_SPHPU